MKKINTKPSRILLADDHGLFRKGIASLLDTREDMIVVGEAEDGLEAITLAQELMPDIILMDVNMPRCNGLEATRRIKLGLPKVHIVLLTVSDDEDDLFEALKYGAEGYLLKKLEPEQLFEKLEGIRQGEAAISGVMASRILQEFKQMRSNQAEHSPPVDALTPRETEVLEYVVAGATNKEIAQTLNIAENTVKIHLRNILDKLHVKNRIQAAVQAVREGLIEEEPLSILPQ